MVVVKSPRHFFNITFYSHKLGPLWASLVLFVIGLTVLSVFRLALLLWQAERVGQSYSTILLRGLRVDTSSMCYLIAIPVVVSLLSFVRNAPCKYTKQFLFLWTAFSLCFLVFLEMLTPTFIIEFDLRPNRLLIEYLKYPNEVFSMLINGYKLEIVFSCIALLATAMLVTKIHSISWVAQTNMTLSGRLLVSLLVVILLFLGARSSLGHRPMNPAMVAFSNDHLLNDLALNSAYSSMFALKQMNLENSSAAFYGAMDESKIIDIVRKNTIKDISEFTNPDSPTLAFHNATSNGKKKNLVILLQESLGARFVGGLGGLPLTPNLDKLMLEGWSFNNLYATGTRSVRGIEAIISGFTPTPSRAVVKLDKSQKNFFTIASLLRDTGYHTQFVYGGESHFDNMKSFFLGNGFNDIVDIDDFKQVDFEGSWGASDEDLYNQAHFEFEALSKQGKPFFSLVFTSSNHTPFEYPDGKIVQYDGIKQTRNNAAKYADYALGEFFKKAKRANYWDDTIFLIVADHDSRVHGASLVPIPNFQIPGVILGAGIAPNQDNRLVSQIDLPPTLLSLIGVGGNTPMIGHDLTQIVPVSKQRAMMQYDKNFAYMTVNEVTILQPEKDALAFFYEDGKFKEANINQSLADRARAHVLLGSLAYQYHWHK